MRGHRGSTGPCSTPFCGLAVDAQTPQLALLANDEALARHAAVVVLVTGTHGACRPQGQGLMGVGSNAFLQGTGEAGHR